MAYKIDKNGMLVGDGLPDGVAINTKAYQAAFEKYEAEKKARSLFPSSYDLNSSRLSASATKFKVGPDGKTYAFFPELVKRPIGMESFVGGNSEWQERRPAGMGEIGREFGTWIEASGIALDEATKSGATDKPFTFKMEGGAPLAVFGNDSGYMRLATNAPKAPDNIQLGNNSGTVAGSIRQNAQRRTLL